MDVTLRCYHTAVSRVVVLRSRSLPPPLPRLSCRNRPRSQASVVFSQTVRNQDARRTTPWTMATAVIMVVVRASVFVTAVIGLLGNPGKAVSPAGGESSQPLSGGSVEWLRAGLRSPKWWAMESFVRNERQKGILENVFECTNPLTESTPETSDLQLLSDNKM
jgi:hypothetical protein